MKSFLWNKRGISQIITILIILGIVLVTASMVWYSINNIIESNTERAGTISDCIGVTLEIISVGACYSGATECNVTVERKAGGGDIGGIKVIVTDDSGTLTGNVTNSVGPLSRITITATGTALDSDATNAKAAVLVGSESEGFYTCEIVDEYDY